MVSIKATALTAVLAAVATARKCQNLTLSVHASARNGVFSIPAPVTNIDVTNFILDDSQQGGNYTEKVLSGYATVSGDYSIAATYCNPDSGPSETVQLLTHGIGFDRSYWDLPANNYNYSYVSRATEEGYSTFSWDRLGVGHSQHGDPVNEIQSFLEIAALETLTEGLRDGKLEGISTAFKKVIHVGHSFGSVQSYALANFRPELSDGIVLTGFSQNATFLSFFLLGGNFIQANKVAALSAYPNGYFAPGNPSGVQTNFFSPGQFDPAILDVAYQTGQPVTVGELLTIGGAEGGASAFPKPVLIVTGGRDVPFCGGDCLATGDPALPNIPSSSKQFLPRANPLQVSITPGAGHGLNLEYSHPTTYKTILDFVTANVPA